MDEINSSCWKEKAFEQYGLSTPHRTAKKGRMSFAKGGGKDGWMITHAHWLPRLISTAGKYDGAANKFLQGHILDHIVQGRIHAELHPFKTEDSGTRSFRFSYSEPPLQQIPKRDSEIMPLIRCCFLPEEGEVWATADANQQEFRIFVHEGARHGLAGAHEAAEFYRNDPNADFHKWVEELVQTDRTAAKGINFGNIYGAGLVKLAEMMRKTPEEAGPIIAEYNRRLPFVKKLSQLCQNEAESLGYTEMPNGGRRHWAQYEVAFSHCKDAGPCSLEEAQLRVADPEHPWHRKQLSRYGTYKALNALIQGSAAIHTKNWMLACWREGIVPRLQVHDALECSSRRGSKMDGGAAGCER
jgi:DNA polymerase I-like protein with 3'-5' exonuclease and polymerase domains